MDDLRQRLIAAFRDEQRGYIDGIRAILGKIGCAPPSATPAELEEAFRLAHCLKAAARVCDFRTVESIGQRIETLLAKARRGETITSETIAAVNEALAGVEHWALLLADNAAAAEPAASLRALDRVLGAAPAGPKATDELAPKLLAAFQVEHKEHLEEMRALLSSVAPGSSLGAAQVDDLFRRAHSLKGAARIAGLRPAEALAHRLETLFAAVRDGRVRLDPGIARIIERALDTIEDTATTLLTGGTPAEPVAVLHAMEQVLAVGAASEPTARAPLPPRAEPAPAVPAVETVRVSADNLDRLLRSAEQLLTEGQRQIVMTRELAGLGRQIDDLAQAWHTVRGSAAAALRRLADAPEFAAVARYLHLAEQRVQAMARQARSLRGLQQRTAWDLQHQVGRLHEDARRVRMVSAESVLQGFRKMMRDLAQSEGKRVDFQVAGFEIQADRLVLQALKDPLMHALCNAVSHGIEPPEERVRQGKDETGHVRLSLETVANRLRITIEDDGRGIDPGRVAEAAVQRGLLSETEAAALAPAEQARLIFQPGLSTLREVTDVSGRGMGLSVVHEAALRLQGDVDLEPCEQGTRLVLTVPLSVATQRLLLVACRGQTFGIPVHAIERLLRVKPADIERVEGRPMLLRDSRPIPVGSLADLLGLPGVEPDEPHVIPLMVLRSGTGTMAVGVDAFIAERDSLVKRLDGPAARLKKLAGGILLEDGTVALVLNPAELLRAPPPAAAPTARATAAPAPPKRKASTVLVVDDSLTTRTLEKSILEAHGFTVRIATDGVEALLQLRAEPVDLVITDVQMPRMDGFTLLEEIKKDARLARLPVIVVTSMGNREDQERGLALGADAYIVKRKFDHEELLETIRQII